MKTLFYFKKTKSTLRIITFLLTPCLLFGQAPAPTIITDVNGTWKLEPNPRNKPEETNGIKITFTPDSTTVACPDIRLIQTVKRTFYNAAGVATVATVVNGLTPRALKFKEPGMIPTGTGVDHKFCEKDPFYNGNDKDKDASSQGIGPSGTSTSMYDWPGYGSGAFPAGMVKIKLEFEVCAICRSGPFAGVSYGCVKWEFIQNKGETGTSSVVGAPPAITPRSQEHIDATAKFIQTHTSATGDSICPEEIAKAAAAYKKLQDYMDTLASNPNDSRRMIIANQQYEVVYASSGVRKGPSLPLTSLPALPLGDSVMPGERVFVPSGEDLCLRSVSTLPVPDPQIPFQAAWSDLFYGSQENVETGMGAGANHSGIRVKNCGGVTLCAVAPGNTTNPFGQVLYSVQINNQTQQVTIKNNLVSTHAVLVKNVLNNLPQQNLAPGNSLVLNFPGQLPACASTLKLKLFIEGYFNGTGMAPTLFNQGAESETGRCDSVTVNLHNAVPPFPIVGSAKAILNQNGAVVCDFPSLSIPVFVAVRHRNAVETWSANPINFNQGLAMYDFSLSANQAFGANEVQVAPGVWAFYSGDVNHDQSIDLLDGPVLENDVSNFAFGYNDNDVNGDGSVDLLDANLLEQNINNFIYAHIPN